MKLQISCVRGVTTSRTLHQHPELRNKHDGNGQKKDQQSKKYIMLYAIRVLALYCSVLNGTHRSGEIQLVNPWGTQVGATPRTQGWSCSLWGSIWAGCGRGVENYGMKEHKQGKMTPNQETEHPWNGQEAGLSKSCLPWVGSCNFSSVGTDVKMAFDTMEEGDFWEPPWCLPYTSLLLTEKQLEGLSYGSTPCIGAFSELHPICSSGGGEQADGNTGKTPNNSRRDHRRFETQTSISGKCERKHLMS